MTTPEDEGAAESRANLMALKSSEKLRDGLEFRFVTLTFLRKIHKAEQ